MVLTEQELVLAITKSSTDNRVRSALFTRRKTGNFSEQAACDREIQRYLCSKGTIAYKFNCCVIHQPWRFNKLAALPDHGWDEFGPTDSTLYSIYRTLPIYTAPSNSQTSSQTRESSGNTNNLNKRTRRASDELRNNNNFVVDYASSDDKPGWAARFLSCIFA